MGTKQISKSISEQAQSLSKLSSEITKKAKTFLESSDPQEWTIETFIESMTLATTLSHLAHQNYSLIKDIEGYQ
jgi:hypothetical protein